MRYPAVIFDLWGTLIDSIPPAEWNRTRDEMARILGAPVEAFGQLWLDTYFERNTGRYANLEGNIEDICRRLDICPSLASLRAAAEIRYDLTRRALVPREGAVDVLQSLRVSGRRIGLITDCTQEIPPLWPQSALCDLIDAPIFSCEVGFKKPDPRIYELACRALAIDPSDCLYVGDGGGRELTGARDFGFTTILIRAPHEEPPDSAREDAQDWTGPVIRSLSELIALTG